MGRFMIFKLLASLASVFKTIMLFLWQSSRSIYLILVLFVFFSTVRSKMKFVMCSIWYTINNYFNF